MGLLIRFVNRTAYLRYGYLNHFKRTLGNFRSIGSTVKDDTVKESSPAPKPDLPDYNTPIDVDSHKLTRPKSRPRTVAPSVSGKWIGLDALAERTKGSLIPDTLKEMENDPDFKLTAEKLKKLGQKQMTKEERKKRQRALDDLGVPNFVQFWKQMAEKKTGVRPSTLTRKHCEQMQINIGLYCNQACNHCHVESSPKRKEMMDHKTAVKCMEILENSPSVTILDLTGGAPELNAEFRYLAARGKELGRDVIVRSNLTSLLEPGQEDTAQFFADNKLHVIASLPCYSAKNVNMQRGKGVFDKSIHALLVLNSMGYGREEELQLDLVYNPLGGFLPPPQVPLAEKYKEELLEHFGIEFNKLFTMTNMPIKRFVDFLYRRNELKDYMELLVRNYNLDTIDGLMCRNLMNINWNGQIYDCDFNQQLDLQCRGESQKSLTVWDISSLDEMADVKIRTDNHCFGCTAGMGSS